MNFELTSQTFTVALPAKMLTVSVIVQTMVTSFAAKGSGYASRCRVDCNHG